MNILPDGSVEGKTFSGDNYKGEHPRPISGETYHDYHQRVRKAIEQGFHLGDLGWDDYQTYCMGSGQYEGANSYAKIY
jgi:hypothetical protein